MSKDNNSSVINQKPSLIQTIQFQLTATNIILLISFILVMYFVLLAMKTSTNSSKEMSDYVLSLSTTESQLKSDVTSLFDQVQGYVMADATETKEALAPVIEEAKTSVTSDISDLKSVFADSGNEEVNDAISDIESQYSILERMLDESMAYSDAGSTETASDTLFEKAEIQKVAISHSCEVIDVAIQQKAVESNNYMTSLLNSGQRISGIGTIIFVVIIALSFLLSYKLIIKKIQNISGELASIITDIENNKGDLTARIKTKSSSELLLIINGVNHFIETLQGILGEVKNGTTILTQSSENVRSQINLANDNITNTSAAMEELSASMETVSGTVSEINNKVSEVRDAATDISNAAKDGTVTASEIKQEADEIKLSVSKKIADTSSKMENLNVVLEQSVKDSEKVGQINQLTNDIMEIANQTNLLSLNASIEAARAGEAGKGFAVVAGEISNLAENSRQTASNIQVISDEVTEAVKALSTNAKDVMEFINTAVLADYDEFAATGEKYEKTADIIGELLDKFTEKASHLDLIMGEMADSISSINNSVAESTQAIGMSAENATNMVGEIKEINEAMEQNTDVTEKLDETTKRFISL